MKKKLFAILMSAMMLVTFMPAMAFAAPAADPTAWVTLRSIAGDKHENTVEEQYFKNAEMIKTGKYTAIDTAKMHKWVESGKTMTLIDTMPAGAFNAAHIPGAINVEVQAGKYFDSKLTDVKGPTPDQQKALKKAVGYTTKAKAKKSKKTIVLYCGFCGCDRSHWAAKYIKSLGFKNVYRYVGGGAAWEDAGYSFQNLAGETVAVYTRPVAK